MFLTAVPSTSCAMHQVRVPREIMLSYGIDHGDWLIFDTAVGKFSLLVCPAIKEDIVSHGNKNIFVNVLSPIIYNPGKNIYIEKHDLTIGSDPEFFIVNRKGTLVDASSVLPFDSQIGCDGELGELRPDFALSPEQHLENLKNQVLKIYTTLPKGLFPIAGSCLYNRVCGFHVHLGLPEDLLLFAPNNTDKIIKNMVSILDYYIGIPSAFIDSNDSRRLSKDYGKLGDYRLSRRTLEYRTPGGYYLKSPRLALSLLTTSFVLMENILNTVYKESLAWKRTEKISDKDYIAKLYKLPDTTKVQDMYYSRNKNKMKEEMKKIEENIGNLAGEYMQNISYKPEEHEAPLILKWLKHETKSEVSIHKEKEQALFAIGGS